jgi:uncharacterized protein
MTVFASRVGIIDWVDLTTPDVESAREFYATVLGWAYQTTDTPMGTYHIALANGHQCAGVMAAEADSPGPPAWTIFVRVTSLAQTLTAVTEAGGEVLAKPFEIPGGAQVAVAADPSGAMFALIAGGPEPGPDEPPLRRDEVGAVAWCELLTREPHAAAGFYDAVFGWQASLDHDTGYTVFRLGEVDVGGLLQMPAEVPSEAPSHWMTYFHVPDANTAAGAVARCGGRVLRAASTVGSMTFAVFCDPLEATFGVITRA